MKKLLIIIPHLSTGGLPQVVLNKIELIKDHFEILVIEYQVVALVYNVQRNKLINLIGEDKMITLWDEDKSKLLEVIDTFKPNVILMEEFPEMFMDKKIADNIYSNDQIKIIETTHDSSFKPANKKYFPDKFIFVSAYNAFKYIDFPVSFEIIEYPVDTRVPNKKELQEKIGLDPAFKHVVIVGLFTERKNQAYAFEMAKKLEKYKIKFHFLGNQADNFKHYWEPLLKNKPENCVVWGERADVPDFVGACDIFLFPSKGDRGNKELNPIAIKEALEHDLVKMMYNLDVYCNKYDEYEDVVYLTGDLSSDTANMLSILKLDNIDEEIIVIGTYPNLKRRVQLTKDCIESAKALGRKIMLVSHYPVDQEIQKMVDYYVYDKNNPLITHSYYSLFYNKTSQYDVDVNINHLHNGNQSLTVLTNIFNGFKHAKANGFKRLFYITFDVIINPKDIDIINESFTTLVKGKKAYLSASPTAFGYGIQTNGMTFDVDYFLQNFDDVIDKDSYNRICAEIGSQNFLEDYLVKKINQLNQDEIYLKPLLQTTGDQTFLTHSGTGVSSYSEYYSILPVEGKVNTFMFYFFTYNIDSRVVKVNIGDVLFQIDIAKTKEYKYEFAYTGKQIDISFEFYDGDNMYKREIHTINNDTLEKYKNTGKFVHKNIKPKIKVVHITTKEDARVAESVKSVSRVVDFGWDYIVHMNENYKSLPPIHNCVRPDCVSMTFYDQDKVQLHGPALTPSHYGCYESFKNAILTEFHDCDFLMVCEADCIIEKPIEEFVRIVEECALLLDKKNIGYMSFGDKATLDTAILQSPVVQDINDAMYITNHLICIQSIMFPKSISGWLKDKLRTEKWDAADMYFNQIFNNSPYKMGIVKHRLTTQADGISMIDQINKTNIKWK